MRNDAAASALLLLPVGTAESQSGRERESEREGSGLTYQRAAGSTRGRRVFYTLSPVTDVSLRTLGGRDQDSGCNPIITLMSFICSARCLDTIATPLTPRSPHPTPPSPTAERMHFLTGHVKVLSAGRRGSCTGTRAAGGIGFDKRTRPRSSLPFAWLSRRLNYGAAL